jgi:hypothetical protein
LPLFASLLIWIAYLLSIKKTIMAGLKQTCRGLEHGSRPAGRSRRPLSVAVSARGVSAFPRLPPRAPAQPTPGHSAETAGALEEVALVRDVDDVAPSAHVVAPGSSDYS